MATQEATTSRNAAESFGRDLAIRLHHLRCQAREANVLLFQHKDCESDASLIGTRHLLQDLETVLFQLAGEVMVPEGPMPDRAAPHTASRRSGATIGRKHHA